MIYNYEFAFKADNSDTYIDLPFPKEEQGSFTWAFEEACTEDSGKRTENATANKKVIAKKRALTVKYSRLPHSQYAKLVNAIKGSGNGGTAEDVTYGHLKYPDVENMHEANSIRYVYTGNLEASSLGYREYGTGELLVQVSVKFIEV